MKNLNENEKMLVKYGLALASEEITNKIHAMRNMGNNINQLSAYKLELQKIMKIMEKI